MPEPDHNPGPPQAHVVAYQHPELAGVLLCHEHGESWAGLVPLTAGDLPHGGFCGWGTSDSHVCGRALATKKPRQ
ncbi:hypothetical protein [Streptomyces anulatus]|uniref:hypothetical protein n=1 Tax=Streptomyces anulatus TaxID=1892 RepID=UPI0004C9B8E5|nr:hypothetical protein [Streptomyces anulatus]